MQHAKSMRTILMVVIASAYLAPISLGQEYRKGDEVMVRRDAALKVETETVGTVRNGDRLVVEDVRGKWLWVRSGQTRGWIESDSVTAAGAPPAPGQQRHRLQGKRVAIYNLVGNVEVVAGSGPDVLVEMRREGRDSHLLRVASGPIEGCETLRVIYPADRIVYARLGPMNNWTVRVRDDGTFNGGGGRRVIIVGMGPGLEAYADMTIRVPPQRQVSVHLAGGDMSARDVEADLQLTAAGGDIEASGIRGELTMTTGGGDVSARNVQGALVMKTGGGEISAGNIRGTTTVRTEGGNISANDIQGELRIDTGGGDVKVGTVQGATINTGGGEVSASDVRGVLTIRTGGGDVSVRTVQGALTINTGGGNVQGTAIRGDTVRVDVGGGDIRLSDVHAPKLHLETGGGEVDLGLASDVEDVAIRSGAGNVTLRAPKDLGAQVDLETGDGRIETKLPITRSLSEEGHVRGTVGDGRGQVKINTGSGDLRLLGPEGGGLPSSAPSATSHSSAPARGPGPPMPSPPPRFPANLPDMGSLPGMPEGLDEAMKELGKLKEEIGRGNTKGFEEKKRAFEKKMKAIQEKMKASGGNREDSKPQGRPPLGVPPAPPAPPPAPPSPR
jgi:DUF4097 and DUF4098 domain-containing protein YvlB